MDEFHYRIPWRSGSAHPGHHRSRATGGGYEFHSHAPLIQAGDPRHLDIRASLSDPFGQFKVRQFLQTSIIQVQVIADLSASMKVAGKPALLARLVASIAFSACRTGDPFACLGIGASGQAKIHQPPSRHRRLGLDSARQVQEVTFAGEGLASEGLNLSTYLGQRRSLVFLLSDYHFPLRHLERLLEQLHPHDVVPVVLWLQREWEPPVRHGLAQLRDPESGIRRLFYVRPALKRRLGEAFAKRRKQLTDLCQAYGRPPFFVIDEFRPDAFSHYFLETCA